MSDLTGKTLGPYRLLEQIGVGGMATVYRAYQPSMDRDVAIKVLPHYLSEDRQFAERFQREAHAIAKLEHAHILPVYDYGACDGVTYIAMRYVHAGTLKDLMAKGPLSLDEINRLISQVGSALDYAHSQGVIHRDIKPSNVLIDDQGNTYLTDFGLARMLEASQQLTASGVGVGTPAYMSPEQGQGIKVDHRSDIYSLGVMLYEMVTGRVPYEAETPMAVVLKHITEALPLPRAVAPNVPEVIEKVILRAMAKDPAHRFQSACDLVQALNQAVRKLSPPEPAEPTVVAEAMPTRERIPLMTRIQRMQERPRNRALLIVGAAALLAVLGLLFGQLLPVAPRATATMTIGPAGNVVVTVSAQGATSTHTAPQTPAPTTDRTAEIRAFADPILAAIANRPPDYQNDFSDPNSGWDIASYAEGQRTGEVGYKDGEYFLIAGPASMQFPDVHSWLEIPALEVSDFAIEFDTRFDSVDSGAIYLHFRVREKNVYFANLTTEGSVSLGTQTISGDTPLAQTWIGPIEPNQVERLRIVAQGPQIAVYLNGQPAIMTRQEFNESGGIILGIWNDAGKPMQVNFDNFKVWDISELPATVASPATQCRNVFVGSEGNYNVHIRNCDGSGVQQVTDLVTEASAPEHPVWSPDGQAILFVSRHEGNKQLNSTGEPCTSLYVIRLDGTGLARWTRDRCDDQPSWSPDGTRIAFHRECDLAVMNLDGTGTSVIARPHEDLFCIDQSAWSPDGKRIAFTSLKWPSLGVLAEQAVFVASPDGSDLTQLAAVPAENWVEYSVVWSPDGNQIAFSVVQDGLEQYYSVNSDGSGEPTRIIEIPESWYPWYWPQWGKAQTATPGSMADQARAFAEPILQAIANRQADFEDYFSTADKGWGFAQQEGSGIRDGAARLSVKEGSNTTGNTALNRKDFVLSFDARVAEGDKATQLIVNFHNLSSEYWFYLAVNSAGNTWLVDKNVPGDQRNLANGVGNVSSFGITTNIMIVARGPRAAIYLNGTPVAYFEDADFNTSGGTGLFCQSLGQAVCEFDNVKFWNLANVPGLP